MERYSNIQQELLKLYSSNVEEQDLINIKKFLSDYFAQKSATDIWQEKSYNCETIRQWLNEDSGRYE
jgi:hypothetical protein